MAIFLDGFADLDELRSAGVGMRFQLAAARPFVGVVVMIDIAEEQARLGLVDDQAQIEADARRPEVTVLRLIDAVHLGAGLGGVDLEIEGGGFNGFLLFGCEAGEAVGEGVGDSELHRLRS